MNDLLKPGRTGCRVSTARVSLLGLGLSRLCLVSGRFDGTGCPPTADGQAGPEPVATPTRLKALLYQRHWQTYRTFQAEYDRAAKTIDPKLVATWPSRAQLHRWMAGELRGLPYPEHCRILEAMFPGFTAAQLFEADPGDADGGTAPQPGTGSDQAWHGATVATSEPDPDPDCEPVPIPPAA